MFAGVVGKLAVGDVVVAQAGAGDEAPVGQHGVEGSAAVALGQEKPVALRVIGFGGIDAQPVVIKGDQDVHGAEG